MIERASHVSLLYDTRSNGLQTGEVSRFVHQLHYHYEVPMRDKLVVYNVSSSKTPPLAVPKREDIMRRLDAYRKGGSKAISASAINTYLDCPLKFYFSVVEGIREEEEVSETIESDVFGSILHKVMEELYKPFEKALRLIPQEYYRQENGRLSLTGKGFPVYNYIVSLLLAHKEE